MTRVGGVVHELLTDGLATSIGEATKGNTAAAGAQVRQQLPAYIPGYVGCHQPEDLAASWWQLNPLPSEKLAWAHKASQAEGTPASAPVVTPDNLANPLRSEPPCSSCRYAKRFFGPASICSLTHSTAAPALKHVQRPRTASPLSPCHLLKAHPATGAAAHTKARG